MNIAISFHQIFSLLQNRSVIQKSNKNSGFNLFSLFHHKLTITFCNNMSSIKREVRGKDSYILEFWKCSCRQSSSHEFWCRPCFCKKYKDGNTPSSLSSTRTWPIVPWHQGKSSSVISGTVVGQSGLQKPVVLSSDRFVTLQSSAGLCCQ